MGGDKLAVKILLFSNGVLVGPIAEDPPEERSAFLMDCLTPVEREEVVGCPEC